MKNNTLVVKCIYAEKTEKSLAELLNESFRLYLIRILAVTAQSVVQYLR